MAKRKLYVEGMTCSSCEKKVEGAIRKQKGIQQVIASYQTGSVFIQGDRLPETALLEKAIAPLGYHITKPAFPWKFTALLSFGLAVYFGFSLLYGKLLFDPTRQTFSFGLVIAYGLVSSLHCVGMCGSIAMGSILRKNGVKPLSGMWSYQIGRLISYTLSGLLLGALGQVFTISAALRNMLLLAAGIWMLILALQMAGILRINLPSFRFKTQSRSTGSFVIGLLNALMPCGALQTMQIIALTTTNMWLGGAVMLIFGLMSAPSLVMMQWFATRLSAIKGQSVKMISALIVALMGFQMVMQSPLVYQPIMGLIGSLSPVSAAPIIGGVQEVHLKIVNGEYRLSANTVTVNEPVRIVFDGYENTMGCANPLVLSWADTRIDLRNDPQPFVFTPTALGKLEIHCWMNMVRATLTVQTKSAG